MTDAVQFLSAVVNCMNNMSGKFHLNLLKVVTLASF